MDAVITYVNGEDPAWQKIYFSTIDKPDYKKRFRDWGTLKYIFRGIDTFMPFVENVYLILSTESQIPQWIDQSKVKIVLHDQIIPKRFLPTFNSTAIEMFIPHIKGLSEEFIYLNDDFFPIMECQKGDFFENGLAKQHLSIQYFAGGLYRCHTKNSDRLAQKALGRKPRLGYMRPQHNCATFLKSECLSAYRAVENDILETITPLRDKKNINQYFYIDYIYYKGKSVKRRLSGKYFSLAIAKIDTICKFIENPSYKFLCINDVNLSDEAFKSYQTKLHNSFERRFPKKSRYEL